MILIVMFLALLALVLINVPIAVSLGVVAIFAMALSSGLGGYRTRRSSSTRAP